MKIKKCLGVMLALSLAIGSLGISTTAAEPQNNEETVLAIERVSGHFSETVSAGKTKKLGSAISLQVNETVNFNASYSPRSASMDFGVVDSNNVFTYINVTNGSVDGGVTVTTSGQYTPAIRNNSSDSVYVTGIIECYANPN